MQRYISMNVTQKPFDNPKVREAINYAINRQALVKVAFAGYATPATGVVPPSIAYAQDLHRLAIRSGESAPAAERGGAYPNGFQHHAVVITLITAPRRKLLQFTQQQLAQVGI
ncbi:dipeptide-binding ABC transporter, periplasmic substrate-binding component [Klebsiella pneumoniae]|uniref:Dipeptide-binding ABC transporter, periplasmic substrate-binding component n=1 Tax=Klebsiella pneumoniae TaxID=573 RepID=A0A3S4GM19_KLEPN|nr:dipeptide-binding ABC transporter, periplasmic substrate-binding component [Klebsiella pneumoniae]